MRTTVRIDDAILSQLRERAHRENEPLTRVLERTLRAGLEAAPRPRIRRARHREKTFAMGAPLVALDKALALAGRLEDDETVRKMMLRK